MKLLGTGFHWDELTPGDTFKTYGRTITETDIVNFVSCAGMLESLFVDAEYRKTHSAMSGHAAPAMLTMSLAEGLVLNATGQGTGLAFLNMEMTVKMPVFVGDTIHVEIEVEESRKTSKSSRGLVKTRNRIVNQNGATVIEYSPQRLMSGSIDSPT
ncbi:MaoC/PaaZ C-terminal domain-containing protein [Labrenzia sp. PHM005]|uniref:MaoC family dehydratase n=1 Tax=Labrenzia sp. PHM005 TaxID=2590016 RepID=UPI00113FE8A7|nr:MaoC/PaaZ C-terminal domain-containing protein [Labrenzia sp. PHM005]QDG78866.1 acyl dehydratase [Labrenzia sp. PHM005]